MNEKLIGSFYFKKTVNGNLIGEFTNNLNTIINTESSDMIESNQGFIGTYNSTWHDTDIHLAELNISHKVGTNNRIFTVNWIEKGIQIYDGEGFLFDAATLIGFYKNPEAKNELL